MAGTGTKKSKSSNLQADEVARELQADQGDRDEQRRESEEAEQQDLNQGMDTGTHDSTRTGVDWGPSYRTGSIDGKGGERSIKQRKSTGSGAGKRRDKK